MERERARIAADLHDDLGPLLSVIKFRVNHQEKEELERASEQLDEAITRMREVSNDLMPSVLQRKGLIAAIQEFVTHAQQSSRIGIIFELVGEPVIPGDMVVHIFRIVQECVHNCIKHANASFCEIRMEQIGNDLLLECRDNGIGFDTKKESEGIGIRSLHNRTAIMNGTLHIHSVPAKGTNYSFEIPVHGV
jgi:signal transduction histidine kinase